MSFPGALLSPACLFLTYRRHLLPPWRPSLSWQQIIVLSQTVGKWWLQVGGWGVRGSCTCAFELCVSLLGCGMHAPPWVASSSVAGGVILPQDVLFTFSFLQQLSVLVSSFVPGWGQICGTKRALKHQFALKGSYCAQEGTLPFMANFPFVKLQIILVKIVKNLLPRGQVKDWNNRCDSWKK